MSLSAKLRRAPQRAVTGAFILNSGVGKLGADDETAKHLHGMACGTYPFLDKVQPAHFVKGLAVGEIALGSAILLPIVPAAVAGAALVGFSGALLTLYWRTPGMHEEGDPRPTPQGTGIAKDVWMFGIGTSLLTDALLEPAHDKMVEIEATVSEKRAAKSRRAQRKAKKQSTKGGAKAAKQLLDAQTAAARQAQKAAAKAAKKAAEKAQKRTAKAADQAARRLAEARAEYGPVAAEKAKHARDTARGLAEEYGPVAAEKAKHARDTARGLAEEYGPVAAEKAKQARDAAKDWADEYAPVAAEKAKQARDAAVAAGLKARERVAN